jgi:prophage tail gpP-like protein
MNDDTVRVIIDGKELTGWEGVSIEMAVDHIADAISVDGPWDWARKDLRAAVRPFGFQPLQVFIDDDLYLTGRVDKVGPKLSSDDRAINVQGRSLTGQLADCSHKGDAEFGNSILTLAGICRKVCKPFGISVRADNDSAPIPECRAEYGQIAADFLNALAAPKNILLNASYKGELVLTWGATFVGKPPGARLVEGEFPVESVEAEYDSTKRFNYFEVATQFAGRPDDIDFSKDSTVPIYRPICSPQPDALALESQDDSKELDGQKASQAKAFALKSRSASRLRVASLAEAVTVNVGVTGWRRPDGKRWAERQTVTLLAPSAMIYKEVPWLIAGVTLKLDTSGGRTTSLRLALPETYSGTMPKELPWVS